MTYEMQGGGLKVSWVQVGVMEMGEGGGPVPGFQCLPMLMGVVPYMMTVSYPQIAGEDMKLGLPLIYRSRSDVNKLNASRQYMWAEVRGRIKCVGVLFGKDAETYLGTLSWGIERARGPLLEVGVKTEAVSSLKTARTVIEFETSLTFYWFSNLE